MEKRVHHGREVTEEEAKQLRTLSGSRTQPYRMVQRAKLIVSMLDDETRTATQAAKQVGFKSNNSGACWVKRFNEDGIEGLLDKLKSGKPRIHSDDLAFPNRTSLYKETENYPIIFLIIITILC